MKKDNRGRRNRNTLTVDLGRHGQGWLNHVRKEINAWMRNSFRLDKRLHTDGAVVRFALLLAVHVIGGSPNPIGQTLGLPVDLKDGDLRGQIGNTQRETGQ